MNRDFYGWTEFLYGVTASAVFRVDEHWDLRPLLPEGYLTNRLIPGYANFESY